ncbi:MAG: rhodanese-related sulfurtransferase [Wenzhouxiangellaceae bacterium]
MNKTANTKPDPQSNSFPEPTNTAGDSRPAVLSGYQFLRLDGLALKRARAEAFARERSLKGTVLLAEEGINFSLSGADTALREWLDWIAKALGADAPVLNRQRSDQPPFLRLKVRLRDEIVTFDPAIRPGIDDRVGAALAAAEWNRMIARDDVQIVDTRNDYEYRLGTFERARNPGTASFAEFKTYCRDALDPDRPVAMFCTGGVRCEKASIWLRQQGFEQVFQLHGGILGYLAEIPAEVSRWRGECFVFDDRVSVNAQLRPTGRVVCRGCRKPAEGLDAAGVPPIGGDGDCRICGESFDAARLGSLRERARQVRLARARGASHLGPEAQK